MSDADDWPALLRGDEPTRAAACARLRDLLVRAALAYLTRLGQPAAAFGADTYEEIAEEAAQEAIAIVLRQLDAFRGDARFTTWAYRIVVNLLADEARRRAWRRRSLAAPLALLRPFSGVVAGFSALSQARCALLVLDNIGVGHRQ